MTDPMDAAHPAIWAAMKAYCEAAPRIPVSAKQAADRYERMKAAIAAYLEAQWQPISTAPKDGTHILAYRKTEMVECWWRTDLYGERSGWGGRSWHLPPQYPPTHWQPLPEPPRESKGLLHRRDTA